MQVIAAVNESLKTSVGTDDKRRATRMVYTAYDDSRARHLQLSVRRPAGAGALHSRGGALHYLLRAGHFDMLHHAEIHFTQPDARLCWPRFRRFCICPSSTLTRSAELPRLRGCWSWRMRGAGGVTAKPRSSPDGLIRALFGERARARRQTLTRRYNEALSLHFSAIGKEKSHE